MVGVSMIGGIEAELVAAALNCRWAPSGAPVGTDDRVVVFGTFDDLLDILRARPTAAIWRPSMQRLPLPRGAAWALRRLLAVAAPDAVIGDAARAAGVPTVVVPLAIAPGNATVAPHLNGPAIRLAIVLDELDHNAGAALTVIDVVARGAWGVCTTCHVPTPARFDPVTARAVPPDRCRCGGPVHPSPPRKVIAHLAVHVGGDDPWAHRYLRAVRSWLGLDGIVTLDGDGRGGVGGRVHGRTDADLVTTLARHDLHLGAATTTGPSRGSLLAAAAGLATIAPITLPHMTRPWLRPCATRTETVADDTIRVHLDVADAAAQILGLADDAAARTELGTLARTDARAHDTAVLAPRWAPIAAKLTHGRSNVTAVP